jgi:hypothetical protein
VFKQVGPLLELARLLDEWIGEQPGEDEIAELQLQVRGEEHVRELVGAALEGAGVDPERTYWDKIHLRIVPPAAGDGQTGTIGVHRDTWGSNVLSQTNWWLPIRPLAAERTIAFYPSYWSRPMENTSASWNLDEIRERRRGGERDEDIPIVPEPTEPVDTESELRIVIEPGDLLCFSGAHLHASVPNTTAETRCSIELRTVNAEDFARGRGAPDLDGRAPQVPLEWFRSMADGRPLRREEEPV